MLAPAHATGGTARPNNVLQRAIGRPRADLSVDVKALQRRRDRVVEALRSYGYDLHSPEGTFYLLPTSPDPDDVAFVERLGRGQGVRPARAPSSRCRGASASRSRATTRWSSGRSRSSRRAATPLDPPVPVELTESDRALLRGDAGRGRRARDAHRRRDGRRHGRRAADRRRLGARRRVPVPRDRPASSSPSACVAGGAAGRGPDHAERRRPRPPAPRAVPRLTPRRPRAPADRWTRTSRWAAGPPGRARRTSCRSARRSGSTSRGPSRTRSSSATRCSARGRTGTATSSTSAPR